MKYINRLIFNVIIGKILWNDEDSRRKAHTNMRTCFKDIADNTRKLSYCKELKRNGVVVRSQVHFFLRIDYPRFELSFHQAVGILLNKKLRQYIGRYRVVNY